jgi:hypothetical protein
MTNIDKILNLIRLLGKYIAICSVIVAILHGVVYQQFWAPFYVSIACWLGIIIWLIGAGGLWLRKRTSSRSSKKAGAYKPIK